MHAIHCYFWVKIQTPTLVKINWLLVISHPKKPFKLGLCESAKSNGASEPARKRWGGDKVQAPSVDNSIHHRKEDVKSAGQSFWPLTGLASLQSDLHPCPLDWRLPKHHSHSRHSPGRLLATHKAHRSRCGRESLFKSMHFCNIMSSVQISYWHHRDCHSAGYFHSWAGSQCHHGPGAYSQHSIRCIHMAGGLHFHDMRMRRSFRVRPEFPPSKTSSNGRRLNSNTHFLANPSSPVRRRIRGTLDFRPYGMEENKTKEKKHSLRMHRIGEKTSLKRVKIPCTAFSLCTKWPVVFFVNFCLLLQELQNSVYQKSNISFKKSSSYLMNVVL